MKTYSTSEIADILGIHPNTVMLYEKWEYIAPVTRKENGYRVYTEQHLVQMRLVRLALRSELIKCCMRWEIKSIIKGAAKGELEKALELSRQYLSHIQNEKNSEHKIIKVIEEILKEDERKEPLSLNRSEAAELTGVSINVIINWERNGLLEVPRNKKNSYRVYTEKEIKLLRVIKILRQENYCTQCVRKMMAKLKARYELCPVDGKEGKLKQGESEKASDDRLISSLSEAEKDAEELVSYINELIIKGRNGRVK